MLKYEDLQEGMGVWVRGRVRKLSCGNIREARIGLGQDDLVMVLTEYDLGDVEVRPISPEDHNREVDGKVAELLREIEAKHLEVQKLNRSLMGEEDD